MSISSTLVIRPSACMCVRVCVFVCVCIQTPRMWKNEIPYFRQCPNHALILLPFFNDQGHQTYEKKSSKNQFHQNLSCDSAFFIF